MIDFENILPYVAPTFSVSNDMCDQNGHMNVAYYILIFDQNAAETLMTKLDMGEKSA